jgi:hypothetical protein
LSHREGIASFQDSELFTRITYQADLAGTNLVVDAKIIFRGNGDVPPLSENKKADSLKRRNPPYTENAPLKSGASKALYRLTGNRSRIPKGA